MKLKRTTIIQLVATAFMAGLLASRYGISVSPEIFIIAFIPLVLSFRKRNLITLFLVLIVFNFGLWRGEVVLNSFRPLSERMDQNVTVVGQVSDDVVYTDRSQSEFHITNLHILENGSIVKAGGRIRVRGFAGAAKINRGDVVRVSGRLKEGYGNRQGQISFSEVSVIGQDSSTLEKLRRRFLAAVNTVLPGPQGSLGLGFLVGARTLLPQDLEEQLSLTGLTHIVAVSGYNLTIIVRFCRRFLARFSRYLATVSSTGLIIGFLAVTGISPSVARASVVSGLALTAWYYGRQVKPMVLLLVSGALTAGVNPTYIWLDLGWYLSFLAFFGVLVLAPVISARLFKNKSPSGLIQILIETTCAQAMTLPLIALIFGELSAVSLLANVIILPLIPFSMLLTFVAGLVAMFSIKLGLWVAVPGAVLLNFMVKIITGLSSFSWASYDISLSRVQLIVIYTVLLLFFIALRKKIQHKEIFSHSVIE